MTHAEYKEQLAAYALDALDAAEARALDAHLAACPECRAELAELRAAAATLAHASAPVEPAPDTRARLLAQLKATPQTPRPAADAPNGAPGATMTPPEAVMTPPEAVQPAAVTSPSAAQPVAGANPAANVLPFARRGLTRARTLAVLGTLAASVTIAALAVAALLYTRDRRLQVELTRAGQRLHETQQTLATVRAERDLLAAPDAHTTELAGTAAARAAHARLTYDEHTGRALFVAAGLPAPPPGKAYQLWFLADGRPLPGGVFTTDAAGHAELREQIPPQGRHAQGFAVTLEPQAGATAPTGQMYLKS
ncbi:MAG TPA: anti-sigma factor [Pyrinomonadaceae bacterium]|jgi:anti-sigma-K factor RskA